MTARGKEFRVFSSSILKTLKVFGKRIEVVEGAPLV